MNINVNVKPKTLAWMESRCKANDCDMYVLASAMLNLVYEYAKYDPETLTNLLKVLNERRKHELPRHDGGLRGRPGTSGLDSHDDKAVPERT